MVYALAFCPVFLVNKMTLVKMRPKCKSSAPSSSPSTAPSSSPSSAPSSAPSSSPSTAPSSAPSSSPSSAPSSSPSSAPSSAPSAPPPPPPSYSTSNHVYCTSKSPWGGFTDVTSEAGCKARCDADSSCVGFSMTTQQYRAATGETLVRCGLCSNKASASDTNWMTSWKP